MNHDIEDAWHFGLIAGYFMAIVTILVVTATYRTIAHIRSRANITPKPKDQA